MDLNVFEFDYDLTWAALFLRADGTVYGGRDVDSPDTFLSLEGLHYALQAALVRHREGLDKPRPPMPVRTVEQYPAAQRLRATACIHCHQAYDFRREALQAAGDWNKDALWVYPLPQNIGLTMDVNQGNRVRAVAAGSPAARAGVQAGARLHVLNDVRIASIADVQYALHRGPAQGRHYIAGSRPRGAYGSDFFLPEGWRVTDISWRPSTRGLEPPSSVHGGDLTPEEKKALGLPENRLAFRQGNFVTKAARQAGIRQKDVILGLDGEALEMNAQQFRIWVSLHRKVGDRIVWNILREGKRLDLPMTLPGRTPF